jgi:hypothetical protein
MSKRKTAAWYKRGRLWIVRPPDWPKRCELSFTSQDMMIEWAHGCGLVLKDVNKGRIA